MPKWITANIGLKILSIFIAGVVWFHVVTEKNYEQIFTIPLTFKNLKDNLIFAENPPESVKVSIRATGKELLAFRVGSGPTAACDLTDIESGWKRIELTETHVSLPPGSKAVLKGIIEPQSVVLHVDEKIEKTLRVIPNIKGNVEYDVSPATISVTGSRRALQRLRTIETEEIDITNLTAPDTLMVRLSTPEGVIPPIDSVKIILKGGN